jgi:T6SS, Phospholipase effector Tle1-like, catalytic domain
MANMIDCYAAIIRLWRPGDRIYLFGFSRGAYTVRSLAAVIANCGIPTHLPDGQPVKLDSESSRKLASYAVKHVYQFTSSRPRHAATQRQQFLVQTRDLIAQRFRRDHQSAGNTTPANVYPYFIGVFDTVAALLNPTMLLSLIVMFVTIDAVLSWILLFAPDLPLLGKLLPFLGSFWRNFFGVVGATFILAVVWYVYTHLKFDFHIDEYDWKQKLRTIHLTELYQKFYDYTLNPNVPYAKHAISIDENRKDFQPVPWYRGETTLDVRDQTGNIFFEQVWFPGNHADIGGGYEENESRLSDGTLLWMLKAATVIPHPIKYDENLLLTHASPEGRRHDEVKSGWGPLTRFTGRTWTEQYRKLPSNDATMHKSVYERFDLPEAFEYDTWKSYRPETLRTHVDFAKFYEIATLVPATSLSTATALADNLESRQAVG